ncbi:uncharacterized protein LOC143356372 [Halictus rubicundus]|uniref:uncharacterized protein LOC143356372 n=1 Tax=Halictus rubicundus TaxID=77578 RepID=UPI004036157A
MHRCLCIRNRRENDRAGWPMVCRASIDWRYLRWSLVTTDARLIAATYRSTANRKRLGSTSVHRRFAWVFIHRENRPSRPSPHRYFRRRAITAWAHAFSRIKFKTLRTDFPGECSERKDQERCNKSRRHGPSENAGIFRVPGCQRVANRSEHVVVLALTNSFTKRLPWDTSTEPSNDHTMARSSTSNSSLQASFEPPSRHAHNIPCRSEHARRKVLPEGRKTIE